MQFQQQLISKNRMQTVDLHTEGSFLELDKQCYVNVQAERLFLQTRLALRHLAALPRTPPGLPDVLFLCSGSIARRPSGQGRADEGFVSLA